MVASDVDSPLAGLGAAFAFQDEVLEDVACPDVVPYDDLEELRSYEVGHVALGLEEANVGLDLVLVDGVTYDDLYL